MHHHAFPANYPDNSTMMGLGQLVIPSASFNVPAPYIPRGFHDVDQPPFAFSRKRSQSRYGTPPPGAVSIYFQDKDGQYPGMLAVRDSTCLEGRDDTVLHREGDFPPINAAVHIHVTSFFRTISSDANTFLYFHFAILQWPNCHEWAHDIQFCRQSDRLPATRGALYDRLCRLVLNNFRGECVRSHL